MSKGGTPHELMGTLLRRFLIATALLFALLACCSWAVQTFLNINRYKPKIEAAFKQATGLTLKIQGKLNVALLPQLHVTLKDVVVSKDEREIFSVKKISVNARTLPLLLHRQFQSKQIEIDGPKALIAKDSKGHWNFESAKNPQEGRQKTSATGPDLIKSWTLESVRVTGGSLTLRDVKSEQRIQINDINFHARSLSPTENSNDFSKGLHFDGQLDVGSLKSDKFALGRLAGDFQVRSPGSDSASLVKYATGVLDLRGTGFSLSEEGLDAKAGQFDMRAEKRTRDLPWQVKIVDIKNGDLEFKKNPSFSLTGVSIHLEDVSLNPRKPADNFLSLTRKMRFRGQVGVHHLSGFDRDFTDIDLNFRDENGLILFNSLKLSAFGGLAWGYGAIDFRFPVPTFAWTESARNIELSSCFPQLKNHLEGKVDVETHVKGSGKDDVVKTLRDKTTASVAIQGSNLVLDGFDIDSVAGDLKSADAANILKFGTSVLTGAATSQTKVSKLRTLMFDWHVTDGIAQTQDVAFSTAKNTLAFQGQINFHKLAYQDFLVATVNPRGCAESTIGIAGPLGNPTAEQTAIGATTSAILKTPESIFEGAIGLVKKDKNTCDEFYSGSALENG